MKKINLKNKNLSKKKFSERSLSLTLSGVIMLVVFLAYGAIYLLDYAVARKDQKIQKEIKMIEEELQGEKFRDMYIFGKKLIDLESQMGSQELLPQTQGIIQISQNTLPSVVFSGLNIKSESSSSQYDIEIVVPDYNTLAKQIKIFKDMENIHNFLWEGASVQEEGGLLDVSITFELGEDISSNQESTEKKEDF